MRWPHSTSLIQRLRPLLRTWSVNPFPLAHHAFDQCRRCLQDQLNASFGAGSVEEIIARLGALQACLSTLAYSTLPLQKAPRTIGQKPRLRYDRRIKMGGREKAMKKNVSKDEPTQFPIPFLGGAANPDHAQDGT
jgi:hypothetical protein